MNKKEERELAQRLVAEIKTMADEVGRKLRFMEVCGTHTVSIFRAGIRQLLPDNVELVSGPGCPVCVTPDDYMDKAIAYAQHPEVIITTFGDMLKVPGTKSSLGEAKTNGADIRTHSDTDLIRWEQPAASVQLCKKNLAGAALIICWIGKFGLYRPGFGI